MTTPAPAPSPAPENKDTKKKARRTWKQRLKITAIVLVIGLILIRIALNFLLPTVVRKVAHAYDLDCTYDRMSLGLLSGNAHIWNLELRPRSGGDSIIQADYIQGSISTPDLFRGRLVVYRAEVDGVDMLVDREPDGSIPLLHRLMTSPDDAPISVEPEPDTADPADPARPVSLDPPLRIDAIRLSHVTTTFRDRSITPTFETTIRTSLRISDVGSNGAPTEFELQVEAEPVLDTLLVRGIMHSTSTDLDADLLLELRGLHPRPASPYLLPLGIRPIANDITISARAKVTANVIPDTSDITARLTIHDVLATVDSTEWASLKTIALDARRINPSTVELGELLVETGRASAVRSAAGHLAVAGFELVPVSTAADPQGARATADSHDAPAASDTPSPATQPALPRISLDQLRLADLQASFTDRAVTPTGELIARLDEMTLRNLIIDPAATDAAMTLQGTATFPNLIGAVTWNGTLIPFAASPQAAIKLRADGIRPDALRPYLTALGLESTFNAGVFTAELTATHNAAVDPPATTAHLSNIRLVDGDATLLDLSSAAIEGLSIDPDDGAIHVRAIHLTGPILNLQRDPTGALAAFGLRTQSNTTDAAPAPAPAAPQRAASLPAPSVAAAPAASTPPVQLPRIQIDRYTWDGIHLNFEDHYHTDAPVRLQGRAGMQGADLIFDPAATQQTARPGRFNAWLELPGIAERLAIDGSLQTTRHGAALTAALTGEGITGSAIAAYLQPLGIELTLQDGRLRAQTAATVATTPNTLKADLHLTDITYTDGQDELAGIDALRITQATIAPTTITIDRIQVARPRAQLRRTADGAIETAGVRIRATPTASELPAPPAPSGPAGPPAPLQLPPPPIELLVKQLALEDAALHLVDQTVSPALDTTLRSTAAIDNLRIHAADAAGAESAPARIDLSAAIDGILDQATVTGSVSFATDAPSAQLTIAAQGIHGDAIAPYLPPGTVSPLREGAFTMTLDTALANHADGGLTGRLIVRDLQLRDRDTTFATVDAFTTRLNRIDPAGGLLAIDEVSSSGVELDLTLHPDGSIDALGLRFAAAPPAPEAQEDRQPAPEAAPADPPQPAAAPPAPAAAPAPAQPTDIAVLVADARRPLPLLTIGTLDLQLDRLRIHGLGGADAAPLDLARVRLHNTGPIALAGDNPEQHPPLHLQFDGAVDPIVRQFALALEARPFEAEPDLTIRLTASGINGQGLTDILPELRHTLDGRPLTDGAFNTTLTAAINYNRRGPRDLDLSRGFTANFNIKPLEFRAQPDGPVLAGLEEIRGEGITVQPRTGSVIIRSIEVVRPIGRFVRDQQGLHALGLVIPLGSETSADPTDSPQSTGAPSAVAAADSPAPAPAAPSAAPQRPTAELRLDRFAVSGIDVILEDRTTSPATLIPLRTFDLEVRDISNQMLWTGRPMRFDMLCTADKVPLPPRRGFTQRNVETQDGLELRELFSQITANGRIGMKQTPAGKSVLTGWAKTSVSGFELLGVRGLAEAQDIVIGGGILDDTNDIRFKDDGTIETRNRIVFTNLSLSEPPNGPIQRILQLPAPIDVALGAVTDPDGSITFNLPVTIESGEVDTGKVIGPAIGAIGQVLITAMASAPVKAVGGVTDLIGLTGRRAQEPEPPIELAFLPGVATLEPAQARQLALLAERMRRDANVQIQLRHQMTLADVAHAAQRANPPLEDVHAMIDRLRRRRAQLLNDRALLATEARAQFATHAKAAPRSVNTLRTINREIARIDASLEQLGDLLRPGAAGQADRRTRAATLDIAQQRVALIESTLTAAGIPAERIHKTNPQFDPQESPAGGQVVITVIAKKR